MTISDSIQVKTSKAKKMMLWFGITSLAMSFAGLTSAFIVSSSREDWLVNFTLPSAFTYSTLIIILSSILLFLAKQSFKNNKQMLKNKTLLITGGTGSFGNAVLNKFLNTDIKEIRIFPFILLK